VKNYVLAHTYKNNIIQDLLTFISKYTYTMSQIPDIDLHLRSSAKEFILPARREKGLALLTERPSTTLGYSLTFFNSLDHKHIEQNDLPTCISFLET